MKLKFLEKKKEVSDIFSFTFEPLEPTAWVAGQFLIYFLPHEDEDIRGNQRYFTISASPFEKNVMLTTRIFEENRSSFKKVLNDIKPGENIEVKGPDGDFVLTEPNREHVFIAGGIGITPFRSIIGQLDFEKKPINIILLYANQTEDFPFKLFFEEIASRNPNFKIHYIVSPKHIDEQVIKEAVPNINEPIFYVSGPEPMVESFDKMLKEMEIKDEKIKTDYFPGYDPI